MEDKPRYFRNSIDTLAEPPASLAGVEEWQLWFKSVLCGELKEDGKRFPRVNIGQWAITEAWAVEGLAPFCEVQPKGIDRLRLLHDIWKRGVNRRVVKIARQGPNGGSLKQDAGEFSSAEKSGLLYWQLSRARVFEAEPSPLWPEPTAALSDLLLSSSKTDSWERWLPRLVLGHDQGDLKGAAIYEFAHQLGARKRVDEFSAEQWRLWLDALAADDDRPQVQHSEQDLSGFLHKLAGSDPDADISPWASDARLPCLRSGGHVAFCRLDDLLVIDDARYLVLRKPLIEGGQAVLLASPKDGKRLLDRFKRADHALSRRLQASVEPGTGISGDMGFAALDQWRGLILTLVAHQADKKEKAAKRLSERWPARVLVQTPLRVRLVLDRRDLGVHRQDFHWDDAGTLYVDSGADDSPSRCRENLALALQRRCGDSGAVFEALVMLLEKAAQSTECAYDLLVRKGLSHHDIDEWQPSDPEPAVSETPADTADFPTDPSAIQPEVDSALTQVPARGVTTPPDILPPAPPAPVPNDPEVVDSPQSLTTDNLPAVLGLPRGDPSGARHSDRARAPASVPTNPAASEPVAGPRQTPPKGAPAAKPTRGQDAREHGERGEAWLRERLSNLLTPAGYTVSDRPDQSGGGESDIAIGRAAKTLLQIEVKVMKTGEIFWSQFEVEKARSCSENSEGYVFAILTPNMNADPSGEEYEEPNQERYRVRWIADPLQRLLPHWQRAEVNGRWYWTEQPADRQALAKSRPWTRPRLAEQPKRRPSRLNFVIKPRPEDYDGEGLEHVRSYLLGPP